MLGPSNHFLCRTQLFAFFAFVLNDLSHYAKALFNPSRHCLYHIAVFQLVKPKCPVSDAMPERAPQLGAFL